MVSIYTCGFNLINNQFDWKSALQNYLDFCLFDKDEVVIAINTSEDETLKEVTSFAKGTCIKIVSTNFDYNDPLCVGKIKNEALKIAPIIIVCN